jgi:hypothetical protein
MRGLSRPRPSLQSCTGCNARWVLLGGRAKRGNRCGGELIWLASRALIMVSFFSSGSNTSHLEPSQGKIGSAVGADHGHQERGPSRPLLQLLTNHRAGKQVCQSTATQVAALCADHQPLEAHMRSTPTPSFPHHLITCCPCALSLDCGHLTWTQLSQSLSPHVEGCSSGSSTSSWQGCSCWWAPSTIKGETHPNQSRAQSPPRGTLGRGGPAWGGDRGMRQGSPCRLPSPLLASHAGWMALPTCCTLLGSCRTTSPSS